MGIISHTGESAAFSSASGGKIYAYNSITNVANTQVAPANPSRRKIRFHNPGVEAVFISCVVAQNTGSDATLTPTLASLGGTFKVYGDGGTLEIEGECQKAWQAIAAAGVSNPLTVMDTNI